MQISLYWLLVEKKGLKAKRSYRALHPEYISQSKEPIRREKYLMTLENKVEIETK